MNLMNTLSVASLLLLGILITCFVILLTFAIVFNTRAGMKYRAVLAKQLDQLRLGKMLTALGINTSSYLARVRAVDIQQHMERCADCTNTQECDTQLTEENINTGSIGYCNNEASLQKIAKEFKGSP